MAENSNLQCVFVGDDTYLMHTYGRLPVQFVSGQGVVLTDSEGKDYLDFLGGVGAVSLGHCHPAATRALQEQAAKVWQVSNYFYVENRNELAEMVSQLLSAITDGEGHVTGSTESTWRMFFSNSGAESNEGAIKIARKWGLAHHDGATGIVALRKSFHGRTLGTLAATGQEAKQAAFRPLTPGFTFVDRNDVDGLEQALAHPSEETGPICAVMLECIQGEGGVWPCTTEFLQAASELCEQYGALLINDEVQTGFFRTGAPFSYQLAGIEPDIVSMAKGIGGGFPMGAVAARAQVADVFGPGDHGSTFGGNALASAVGRTVVQTLIDEKVGEHVIAVGAHLAERLSQMPHAVEVRGAGLMRGLQLDVPVATEAVNEGLRQGLVLNHIGDSILRFLPPLVVTDEQVDEMADKLAGIIDKLAGQQ